MNRRNFLKYLGLGSIVSFFGKFSKAGELPAGFKVNHLLTRNESWFFSEYKLIITPARLMFDAHRLAKEMDDTKVFTDHYLVDDNWMIETFLTEEGRDRRIAELSKEDDIRRLLPFPRDAESARHFITGDRKEHFPNRKYEEELGIKGFYGLKPVIYNQDLGFGLAETKVEYTQTNKGNTKKYTQYFISSEQIRDYKTTKTCYTEEEAWGSFWQDYLSYGQKGGTDIYWRLLPVMRKVKDFGPERMLYSVIARFHLNA